MHTGRAGAAEHTREAHGEHRHGSSCCGGAGRGGAGQGEGAWSLLGGEGPSLALGATRAARHLRTREAHWTGRRPHPSRLAAGRGAGLGMAGGGEGTRGGVDGGDGKGGAVRSRQDTVTVGKWTGMGDTKDLEKIRQKNRKKKIK